MKVSLVGKSLIAAASLLLTVRVASASECVVPQFNPQQHTYMSPTLEQDPQLRDELNGLSDELVTAGSAHQITPYFVACQMNYQQGVPGVQYAHDVFEFWKSSGTFPSQGNVVVIAWVRNGLDTSHGSVAAIAGQTLQDLGFTGDYFASSGGPVLNAIREYMPNNPKGEFVHIVREIGDEIDVQKESARRQQDEARQDAIDSAEREKFFAAAVPYFLLFVLFGLVAWLAVRLWQSHVKNEKARDSIRKKDARITTTLSQVDSDLGAVLAKQGVRAATHVTAVSSLRQRQDEIRKQLRSNPLGVLGSAATLVTDAEGLQREVLRSLELQTSTLPALELRIAHVRETAAARRQSVVAYAFPGTTTPDGLAPLFQLQAEGGNPDTEVASALASIASARACLVDGQIDQAQGHFDAASTYVANAGAIVESTLAAKTGVETIVATIQEARKQLLRDCQSGVQPLQQLRSEFAPVNFEDVANNIDKGKKAAQGVDAVIAEAAAQYFKQDFLAAKARLDNLLHQLNAAKTGVSGISLKLKELTEKRATLLSKVADTGKTLETVSAKFQHNLSHASSRTKQGYETLQEQQRRLSQVSADGSSINWIAMYLLWESFNSGAHTVSLHIDSDRSSYESSQRASQASQSYAATQTYSIDTSSTSSFGGSGGGNY